MILGIKLSSWMEGATDKVVNSNASSVIIYADISMSAHAMTMQMVTYASICMDFGVT